MRGEEVPTIAGNNTFSLDQTNNVTNMLDIYDEDEIDSDSNEDAMWKNDKKEKLSIISKCVQQNDIQQTHQEAHRT